MQRFPFSALVGQDLLKKGLRANAVDATIGGADPGGEKGTGKTTAVRAFAALKGIRVPGEECLRDAFRTSLPHRLKEDPFEERATGRRRLDAVLARFGVGNET